MTTETDPTPLEAILIRIARANAPDLPEAELLRVLRNADAYAREAWEKRTT